MNEPHSCPSNKMVFTDRKSANRFKRMYGVPQNEIYECDRCGQYHMTSIRGAERRWMRKARRERIG